MRVRARWILACRGRRMFEPKPHRLDRPALPIKYAIAVTLEVAEESKLPIYNEIRTRLKVPVRQRIDT